MKLLFISGNLSDGGAQRVISVVASGLSDLGHDVSLLLFSRSDKEYPISKNVKITSFANSYDEYKRISLPKKLSLMRKYLKELSPDAAVGFLEGGYALYLASFGMKFAKIASARIDPKVIFAQKGFRAKINKTWFYNASAVVLQTNAQKKSVPAKLLKKSFVIPNPVSEKSLTVSKASYDSGHRFIMAGRLASQKNYPMVFEAVNIVRKKYPKVHVDIFGKGCEEEILKTLIDEMKLSDNISLLGWTQDTIGEYLKRDAYILSSDFEGMPNALMEAMAVGLPCISTNCDTGPADLIEDKKNGYLIPTGDANALADSMIKIIEMNAESRQALGCAARSVMENQYNNRAICEKWSRMFKILVNGVSNE